MGLFRSQKPAEPDPVGPDDASDPSRPAGKGRPTPSRREAEAARRERLNPTLSPREAKARERAARAQERRRAYEEYDNTDQRKLIRNVVDSRFNIGEIFMPLIMVFLVLTLVPGVVVGYGDFVMYGMWLFLIGLIVDTYLMWRRFKRLAAERLPGVSLKGLLFYGFNRQLSFRRWRQPPPLVKRGESI